MKKLYKYERTFDYGSIFGIFLADPKDIDAFFKNGWTFNFCEILGKCSEIEYDVDKEDFIPLPSHGLSEDQLQSYCMGIDLLAQAKEFVQEETSYLIEVNGLPLEEALKFLSIEHLKEYYVR